MTIRFLPPDSVLTSWHCLQVYATKTAFSPGDVAWVGQCTGKPGEKLRDVLSREFSEWKENKLRAATFQNAAP